MAGQRSRETLLVEQLNSPSSNHVPPNPAATSTVQDTLSQGTQLADMQEGVNVDTPLQGLCNIVSPPLAELICFPSDSHSEVQMIEETSITQQYQPLVEENGYLDFSSDIMYTEPFDFWDPEISLHEMISIGGIPDGSSLSHAARLTTHLGEHGFTEDQQNLRGIILDNPQGPIHQAQQLIPPQRAGKISGLQSLKAQNGAGDKRKRILPGLFIRKDAFNNNFIGMSCLIHSFINTNLSVDRSKLIGCYTGLRSSGNFREQSWFVKGYIIQLDD
jgi:hypothetical protein